jgi:hypothetical protein
MCKAHKNFLKNNVTGNEKWCMRLKSGDSWWLWLVTTLDY